MIAELVLRNDTAATISLVSFVVAGILGSLMRLWWLWWTEGTAHCCGRAPRDCDCHQPPVL